MAGAIILPEATDRPDINIQGARGNLFQGISIRGRNHEHVARKTAKSRGQPTGPRRDGWIRLSGADFDGMGLMPRSQSMPSLVHSAKTVMHRHHSRRGPLSIPFHAPATTRVDIVIDRCWIGGFAVAIAIQPADSDGNGDFVKITRSHIEHCVYAIAVGNGQSRNIAIRDCTYACVHTFVTNKHVGRGIGTLGGPIDNVSGGVSYQFMDLLLRAACRSP
jgi:hypothetical protein